MEPSKSTDKLALLCEAFKFIPEAALMRLKTFDLTWKRVDDDILAPEVKATFVDERVKLSLEELQLAKTNEERFADEPVLTVEMIVRALRRV